MVSKAQIRKEKQEKLMERKDRSICVKLKHGLEKPFLEETITAIHSGIEKVYFPRQKLPRFFFVLCHTTEAKDEVWKAMKEFKNEKVGPLYVKPILVKPPKPEIEKKEKKTIDPLTLVLNIPKKLGTKEIMAQFPACKSSNRFNDRRCYLYFKTVAEALEAFEKIKTEELCGFKVSVEFRKTRKPTKKMSKSQQTSSDAQDVELAAGSEIRI